ncbi:hypothetical protein N7448_010072 [Penicillium atrosanguineum]|uniref:Uncharacterized protein n=1 Tax=Penicillium atrosanguineum TaxID=1132637 RepID=A0A9W9GFB5_9EURO|nr:uncharacterized protein N7443_007290 [Penicillium atrosanguineum]KAJ5118364.1 hypothetical protein N7526_010001 [Penicillium atrosanguineum]KAJ5119403.1 hypothetical protein N7448_010072 [Penicillium atrosanguineum]KAJ5296397.1 hypothetical protein N7443_007290 [Penicillium atrosanguineum]KAJ5299166.1 hypothetical protein N7476_010723 [Penicillium atrosanguineum]
MPFNRSSTLPTLSLEDERYLNQDLSPQSRPMDIFKGCDPVPGNWSYDSAIDLFSLNPADMDPVSFDFSDNLTNEDTKDLFIDPFRTPTAINGFTMPTADDTVSLSSDLDSDDQSWPAGMCQSIDMTIAEEPTKPSRPVTRNSAQNTASTRWSSSPEMKPQEYITPKQTKTSGRKTRSLSQDSNRSSSQDPQMRNAAKRAAHNIIEKRYRTNMNAKFLALEKVISPAGVHKQSRGGAGSLKKSEILSNALAYIESVQQENAAVHKELALLKQNLLPGGMWRHKQPRA